MDAYIWLQDDETSAAAACGCHIDGAAFYQCPLHASAPDLLAALEGLLGLGSSRRATAIECGAAVDSARAAIRKAKGDA